MVKDKKPLRRPPQAESLELARGALSRFAHHSFRPPAKSDFIQLIGQEGSGCRRLAFHFIKPQQKAIWVSKQWRLYSPLLWQIASEKQICLLGLECGQKKKYRQLWRELYESRAFDVWILEGLQLKEADGFFLKQLLSALPIQVLIIDSIPHSFCEKRAHITFSHHLYRIDWSKGGSLQAEYLPATYLSEIKEDLCLL